MDPELLIGSGIIVPDPDPAKIEIAEEKKLYILFKACEFWTVCSVGL